MYRLRANTIEIDGRGGTLYDKESVCASNLSVANWSTVGNWLCYNNVIGKHPVYVSTLRTIRVFNAS